ncbi:MAG: hypothetical protein WC875_01160, partial [Candidatus Absconditabacterales bacterium]
MRHASCIKLIPDNYTQKSSSVKKPGHLESLAIDSYKKINIRYLKQNLKEELNMNNQPLTQENLDKMNR